MTTDFSNPFNIALEEATLGACLLNRDAFDEIQEIVTEKTFYKVENQIIYNAMYRLFGRGVPIDLLTMSAELDKLKERPGDGVTWAYYITELTTKIASAANIEHHARILKEFEIKREAINIGMKLQRDGSDITKDPLDILDEMQAELFRLTGHLGSSQEDDARKLMMEDMKVEEQLRANNGALLGIPCGLQAIDKKLNGLQAPNLIVIAGRPGMGKTALALEFFYFQSVKLKKPVALFSLEMSKRQVVQRLLSMESHVPLSRILDPRLMNPQELDRYHTARECLYDVPFWIDDTPAISIMELRAKARKMKRKYDIQAVYVDYLQLMTATANNRNGNREQEVSAISRGLKALAKDLDIPVIAISQLSRSVEYRADKRPQLSDLRESGSIEQDCDIAALMYRPEYYNIKEDEEGNSTKGICEVLIAKHRNGAPGAVLIEFSDEFTLFRDMADDRAARLANMVVYSPDPIGADTDLPF